MSTNNTENLGFKIVSMGRSEVDSRRPCDLQPLTLDMMLKGIDTLKLDKRIIEELKRMVKAYPNQALRNFQKNISKHITTAALRVKKKNPDAVPEKKPELGDEPLKGRTDEKSYENVPEDPFDTGFEDFDAGPENPGKD